MKARRRRSGVTLVEVLIAFALAVVLIGFIFALFSSGERRGRNIEDRVETVHAASLVTRTLEPDLARAETMELEDGELVLRWTLSHELKSPDYGATQTVRYSHRPGEYLQRAVSRTLRGQGEVPGKKSPVGRHRYHEITFTRGPGPGQLEISLEKDREPKDQVGARKQSFTLTAPLLLRSSTWTPNSLP